MLTQANIKNIVVSVVATTLAIVFVVPFVQTFRSGS